MERARVASQATTIPLPSIHKSMKARLFIALLIILVQPVCLGAPTSYAEFKELTQREQSDLVADETNPSHLTFVRW
jgi:hypothetical protein